MNPDYLKVIKSNTKNYPNRDAVVCDMIGEDNGVYEATFLKEEDDLALYLKCSIFPKLKETEKTQLLKLIENFGDIRYEDGDFDATYEG